MSSFLKIISCCFFSNLIFLPLFYLGVRPIVKSNEPSQAKNKPTNIKYNRLFWYADNESGTYVPYTDSLYISKMSNQEKAAVAFSSIFYDNYCDSSDGSMTKRCSMIELMGLGKQCSQHNIEFLKYWFSQDKKSIGELQGCQIVPLTATYQERFVDVSSARIGDLYLVKFTAGGMDLREMKTWKWKQLDRYLLRKGRMVKLDSKISSREERNLEEPNDKD